MAEKTRIEGAEAPPSKLWKYELADLLQWYEENLCHPELRDPRGFRIHFGPERFPHLIKLLKKGSSKEVEKPDKQTKAIRSKLKVYADYGGYDTERAQTLPWIIPMILRPTMILEVIEKTLWEKPGDTVYVKEFAKGGYTHKLLICRTVGPMRLAVVTCHPRSDFRVGKAYKVVWPVQEQEKEKDQEMAKAAD
jgi:hypothetical protein